MIGRILVVDDDTSMCELLVSALTKRNFDVVAKTSADEAFACIGGDTFDVVVTDLNMKGMSGIDLCERIVANRSDVPVIVMTAFGSLETAVAAIRAGAYDFLTKPVELETLRLTLERAVRHRALCDEVRRLRRVVAEARRFDEILGSSPAMSQVYDLLDRVCEVDASVLITGESGTGKEMVARAIHHRGKRSTGPFVAVNCAAVPEALLESELFGHARGAFTDAKSARAGLFTQASGGTLFLDEIGELPLALQPKILRALQERKVRPVGGDIEVTFDTRIVVATNRDLEAMVESQRFRQGPVLSHQRHPRGAAAAPRAGQRRASPRPALHRALRRYLREEGRWSRLRDGTEAHDLPVAGNVRELQNCIERAVALTRLEKLGVDDLPEKIRRYSQAYSVVVPDDAAEIAPLEEVERRYILGVLKAVGGVRTLAAKKLGLDRKTLYRKLEQYGVPRGEEKP